MIRVRLVSLGGLGLLGDRIRDPDDATDALAAWGERTAKRNLREQRSAAGPFPERMVPNVPGIISDVNKGGMPKKRRWDPRPVPFDTGLLWDSVKGVTLGPRKAQVGVVGAAAEYATVQHEGGESESEALTQVGLDTLNKFLQKSQRKAEKDEQEGDPRVAMLRHERDMLKRASGDQMTSTSIKKLEGRLRKARKEARERIAQGQVNSEHWEQLGWLANKSYVGETLTIKVRSRPWLDFADEDYEEAANDLVDAFLGRRPRR